MTATDELRRLLDERGVEWIDHEAPAVECMAFFDGNDWHDCWEGVDGKVNVVFAMSSEQAIAATLDAGTCHKLPSSGDTVCIVRSHGREMEFGYWLCSECGCECFDGARYCMNCGRRAVEE